SFDRIFALAWLPLLLTVAWTWGTWGHAPSPAADRPSDTPALTVPTALWALAALALALAPTGPIAWGVVTVLGAAAVVAVPGGDTTSAIDLRASRADHAALGVAALVTLSAVLFVHWPGLDDAYYASAVTAHLDHPGLPVLSFDTIYGDTSLPLQQPAHRGQSYALLVAVLARLTGTSAETAYYVLAPPLWGLLGPIAGWTVAKLVAPRVAWLQVLMLVVVLVVWGASDHTYGNYGPVRVFQGKSAFVTVLLPLVVAAGLRYGRSPDPVAWVRLLLAMVASGVLTSTALLMAPVAGALAVLAAVRPTREGAKAAVLAGLTAVPAVLTLLALRFEARPHAIADTASFDLDVSVVLSPTWRGPIALAALLAVPLLARLARLPAAPELRRFVLLGWLIVWSGLLPAALAELVSAHFRWRTYWTFPLPVFVALAVALAMHPSVSDRVQRLTAPVAALLLLGFCLAGEWTVHLDKRTFYGPPQHKVDPDVREIVDAVMAVAKPTSMVLAPPLVAGRIPARSHPPRLVTARPLYDEHMAPLWGPDAGHQRVELGKLMVNGHPSSARWDRLKGYMDALCVDIVFVPPDMGRRTMVLTGLTGMGFRPHRRWAAGTLYTRPSCPR
ncbi:MAG: hypothetical protein KC656_08310, partial [Myxococcales bacterium]|nr:hypothetical protein [Myxococcales bacterium]